MSALSILFLWVIASRMACGSAHFLADWLYWHNNYNADITYSNWSCLFDMYSRWPTENTHKIVQIKHGIEVSKYWIYWMKIFNLCWISNDICFWRSPSIHQWWIQQQLMRWTVDEVLSKPMILFVKVYWRLQQKKWNKFSCLNSLWCKKKQKKTQ